MKKLVLVVGMLGLLMATAFGQMDLAKGSFLQVRIPFDFVAGGKTLPAGNYAFAASNNFVTLKSQETGESFVLTFLTRLAADNAAGGKARISFDVQDGKHYIEGIWPDQGEGYLIHAVKGEHTHEIVRSN